MNRVPAPLLALTAMLSVQIGAAVAKTRFDEVGSVGAATLRLVIGAVVLALVVRPRVRHWTRAQWLAAVLLGLALGGMNLFIYVAFATIPIGVAVTIEFLGPLTLSLAHTRRWRDASGPHWRSPAWCCSASDRPRSVTSGESWPPSSPPGAGPPTS